MPGCRHYLLLRGARALSQKSPISSVLCKEPKRSLFPASYLLWPNETFSPLTRYVRSRPPPARRTRMGDSYVDRKPPYFSSFSLPPHRLTSPFIGSCTRCFPRTYTENGTFERGCFGVLWENLSVLRRPGTSAISPWVKNDMLGPTCVKLGRVFNPLGASLSCWFSPPQYLT